MHNLQPCARRPHKHPIIDIYLPIVGKIYPISEYIPPIVGRIYPISEYFPNCWQNISNTRIYPLPINIYIQLYIWNTVCRQKKFRGRICRQGAQSAGARFAGAQFATKGPNLPGPDLPGPNLPGPNLPGPNLPSTNFPGPNLRNILSCTAKISKHLLKKNIGQFILTKFWPTKYFW